MYTCNNSVTAELKEKLSFYIFYELLLANISLM